jgi:hypothetical protein
MVTLQGLREGNASCLPTLLSQLIPAINNSLVGVSKVLHFIAPQYIPIIDRNVLRGWDLFFFKLQPGYAVPRLPSYNVSLNQNHIEKYLAYRETLIEWAKNCKGQISIRDLEVGFFELGKHTVNEKIELPTY